MTSPTVRRTGASGDRVGCCTCLSRAPRCAKHWNRYASVIQYAWVGRGGVDARGGGKSVSVGAGRDRGGVASRVSSTASRRATRRRRRCREKISHRDARLGDVVLAGARAHQVADPQRLRVAVADGGAVHHGSRRLARTLRRGRARSLGSGETRRGTRLPRVSSSLHPPSRADRGTAPRDERRPPPRARRPSPTRSRRPARASSRGTSQARANGASRSATRASRPRSLRRAPHADRCPAGTWAPKARSSRCQSLLWLTWIRPGPSQHADGLE